MKSLHIKLNEALEKMTSKQRDKFYASRKSGSAVEVQLNCAEAVLAGKVKEAAPVTKNNGAVDNGTLITESALTETAEPSTKGEEALFKALGFTEAEQRKLKGLPESGTNLTASQLREYRFLRSIRLSESDALKGALRVA